MSDSNDVRLKGNLSRPPSVRYTASGKPVWQVSICVDKSRKLDSGEWEKVRTDFFDCTSWDFDFSEYNKGDRVAITGELRTDEWDDKDTGKKRYKTYVLVRQAQLLKRKGEPAAQRYDEYDELPELSPGD